MLHRYSRPRRRAGGDGGGDVSCADVCLSHDVDVTCDFSTCKTVKARKPHKCDECHDVIPVGALYERVTGKWEGHIDTLRTCAPCAEVRKAFVCGGWAIGYLWESMREEMFPVWQRRGAWDCLAKLTTDEAVAKCNERYRDWRTYNDDDDDTPTGAHDER